MSESARGEGGRVWVPRKPQDPRDPKQIPEAERYYFLEERYPKYGNLVPRDIATREIFNVCTYEGLSVEQDRLCVYLDLTHIPRDVLDHKLGGILEIYEKFQGVDPREVPMKIFPAVHYSMGGLWVDYERTAAGGLQLGSPRNQQTNIPGLYAIGECDYQYHGANRLGANSLLSCIFSGLIVAPGDRNLLEDRSTAAAAADQPSSLFDSARNEQHQTSCTTRLLERTGGGENPYLIHQELGNVMTKAATVVRRNDTLRRGLRQGVRTGRAGQTLLAVRHRQLDESERRVHQGAARHVPAGQGDPERGACSATNAAVRTSSPTSAMPGLEATEPAERRREAEAWCDRFEENTRKWLKSTIATLVARRRAAVDLRRRRYVADPAAAAAVRPGRRRGDRRSLERTAGENSGASGRQRQRAAGRTAAKAKSN